MALRLNGSSSGYVELDVPAAAGSHTLTLPDGGGSSGQYLQTNGTGTLSWAGIGDTGKILQVVQTESSTDTANSTTTYSNLLSQTITLSNTSNYVLAFASLSLRINQNTNAYGQVSIFHTDTSGTEISSVTSGCGSAINLDLNFTLLGKHEPASTDEQTYVLAFRKGSANTTNVATANRKYQLILMEVAS